MEEKKNVIAIGYAKRVFEDGSRELERMKRYASALGEFHVIVFTRKSEGFKQTQHGNLFLYPTDAKTKVGMLYAAYATAMRIRKSRPKKCWVVSSQDPFETSLVGRISARGKGAVHHVQMHGDLFNERSREQSFLGKLRVWYGKYVVRHTASIRVVSERIKRSLEGMGVSASIKVVPIRADLETFLLSGQERVYETHKGVRYLYVGRFSSEKNIPLLIRAFVEVHSEYTNTSLTLLGSGPKEDEIKGLIKKCNLDDAVKILVWSNDVPRVMLEHDVLCLSSEHEGWGMVLQEGAATGMPCVSTDVGCVGEALFDGQNGIVVPVGDDNAFAAAMKRYCIEPGLTKQHGEKGIEITRAQVMSEDEFVSQIVDAYPSCTT